MTLDQAMKNPASTFGTPLAVLKAYSLSLEEKQAILQQWKDQLRQLETADQENMIAGKETVDPTHMLQQVNNALLELNKAHAHS